MTDTDDIDEQRAKALFAYDKFPIGERVDLYVDAFFVAKADTHEIARLHQVHEAEVYNAIHAWREAGR